MDKVHPGLARIKFIGPVQGDFLQGFGQSFPLLVIALVPGVVSFRVKKYFPAKKTATRVVYLLKLRQVRQS